MADVVVNVGAMLAVSVVESVKTWMLEVLTANAGVVENVTLVSTADDPLPVGPVGPVAPAAPVGPVGPAAPVAPAGPVGPVIPSPHCHAPAIRHATAPVPEAVHGLVCAQSEQLMGPVPLAGVPSAENETGADVRGPCTVGVCAKAAAAMRNRASFIWLPWRKMRVGILETGLGIEPSRDWVSRHSERF